MTSCFVGHYQLFQRMLRSWSDPGYDGLPLSFGGFQGSFAGCPTRRVRWREGVFQASLFSFSLRHRSPAGRFILLNLSDNTTLF